MKLCRWWKADAGSRIGPVGCLLLLAALGAQAQFTLDREPMGPSSRKTGLVISEIMYNPRPVHGVSTNLTLEFIELYNSKPWDEDLSGFSIDGTVHFLIPSNTVLRAGEYLVVARVPDLIQTNYAITNVIGPWDGAETNRLSTERGTVQLRNRQGAVLLEVNYADSPPWPEAADGTGHSLVLARPSFGEDNVRAWAESDSVGGSPGGPDPITQDPLASVVINEWQNHSDPSDWVELYNHSNVPVDVSGAWLSDDPTTNVFRIPDGTVIPARGFLTYDQTQLHFELFAGGETVFFWNSNQTRVIDVIDFRGQSNNISSGRFPDGGPFQYGLATRTRGGPNSAPIRYPVVINEIMYNPVSGSSDDEYVEIHNRSSATVNLSGWEFVVGISFGFPTNAQMNMPAGAHWVVAKNPTNLFTIYTNLNSNNTFGPYGGTLANGGERIVLAAADYDVVLQSNQQVNAKLPVPVSEVTYHDGGRWGYWSDGQGSSLELIDPDADERLPSNWADSNDTGESLWTAIEWTGPLGEPLGTTTNDSLIVMLEGPGECLVDEIEVRVDNGPNRVANGGFESGLEGWTLQGSHDFSTVETEGFAGTRSLHLRAGSRGDNQSNRILSAPFASAIPPTAQNVSIRAKARWLRGHPELLFRLHGSATEAYGRMALPRRLGTPGQANSRRIANAGPAFYDAKHTPILPAAGEDVVVSARPRDPQGLAALSLKYRVDPTPTYTTASLRDDGTGGDAIANDGIYSATIPGQPGGNIVAFYLEGRDTPGAIGTFPHDLLPPAGLDRCWPNDAVKRECVVRWGEVQMPGDFATYHLWLTSANSNRWHVRNAMDNTPVDGTFIYNNTRVIYNALPLYSGSPWHRTNSTAGPAGPYRVDYEMNFPDDDPLLGATDFILVNPGTPDVLTIGDLSAMNEQTAYKVFEGMDLPHNHRRYMHFFVNGSQRSTAYERSGNFIFEDVQQPNGNVTEEWFPNDAGGQLFKIEDAFEFEPNGFDIAAYHNADLRRRTIVLDGQPTLLPAPYRNMFRKRSVSVGSSANDYSQLFALIDAVSPPDNPDSPTIDPTAFGAVADWEGWMRFFALQRALGNWDSYGWRRGKNVYLYRPVSGGFTPMPWDIDYAFGLGAPANEPLFESMDSRVLAMFNTPEIVRAYWRAFADLVNGPFSNENLDPFLDAHTAALTTNNINIDLDAVAAIKTYIAQRRAFLQTQLETVAAPFATPGLTSFETTNNLLVITGTAPVTVKEITLNGAAYPLTWTSVTNFVLRVVLGPGLNDLTLQGFDRFGVPVADASNTVTVNYTGPVVDPVGALVISEIMYAPATPDAQFIEITNRSALNFDLGGWWLEGANLTFPPGSIMTNGQTMVLARNRAAFKTAYGNVPVFAVFGRSLSSQGQALMLVKPGGSLGDTIVDGVSYEAAAPWPHGVAGASLQLIDAGHDNSRPSNWAMDATTLATPGAANSVAGTLPPYEPLWLNEMQIESLVGPLDNAGEPAPWIELYNGGSTPLSLNGYYLADNYTTNLLQWPFPPDTTLAPGEYKLLWADGQPDQTSDTNLHTSFRLDSPGKLALVRLLDSQPQITDYLTWPLLGANASYGACPDGQAVTRFTLHTPTPGGTNLEPVLRVFINEWMTRNTAGIHDPADSQTDDWFELYNAEAAPVDLGGFYLTDDAGSPTKSRVPANGHYTIPAGGFLLVWADDQTNLNSNARADLHVNFKLSSPAGILILYAPDGQSLVDFVSYAQQTNDVSEGRYTDGASARYFMTKSTPRGPNSIPGYNTPPRFPTIAWRAVSPGQTNTITIKAADPDVPPQVLAYSIVSAPEISLLNQGGSYRWIVPATQAPGDYDITLRVTDNGTPPRSDTTTFTFTVRAPTPDVVNPGPAIHSVAAPDGQITFTIETLPGHTYRVLYKDDLAAPAWTQLDRDFVAANPTASITDNVTATQRFYQVLQLD